jgi:hypothetical protein
MNFWLMPTNALAGKRVLEPAGEYLGLVAAKHSAVIVM